MDLKTFLLARIAEDEELSRAAIAPEEMHPYGDVRIAAMTVDEWPDAVRGYLGGPWGEHAANSNPSRVLAECAAKRAIIGSYQSCTAMTAKEQESGVKLVGAGMVQGLDLALKSLVAVYSDHPDYQQEWVA